MAGDCPGPVTPLCPRLRPGVRGPAQGPPRAGFLRPPLCGEVPGSGLPHEVGVARRGDPAKSAQAASELERLDTLVPGRSAATARSWRRPWRRRAPSRSSPAAPAPARPPRWPSSSPSWWRPACKGARPRRSGWWPHRQGGGASDRESIGAALQAWICPRVGTGHPHGAGALHRLLGVIPGRSQFRHHRGNRCTWTCWWWTRPPWWTCHDGAPAGRAARHARLILLGDKDQLASVGGGAVLGDICSFIEQGISPAQAGLALPPDRLSPARHASGGQCARQPLFALQELAL